MHGTRSIGAVIDAHAEVEGLEGRAGNVVDLTLEEAAEGRVHGELAGVAVGEIHAGGEHGHGNFPAFLGRHALQLAADGVVLRCIDDELQTHVVEGLGDDDTTVEGNTTIRTALAADSGLGVLGGGDVESGIHRIACELHIAAILDGEGLQRDDWQRVFHLTVGEGVTACEVDAFVIIFHAQVAAAHQVDVVALLGIKITEDAGSL